MGESGIISETDAIGEMGVIGEMGESGVGQDVTHVTLIHSTLKV